MTFDARSADVTAIAALVRRRTGLVFAAHRRAEVEAVIRRAMAAADAATPAAYLAAIEGGSADLDALAVELTVGESHFQRHPAQLAWLRERVFPELVRRRGEAQPLRLWSAGCASGEEAYSLVMAAEACGLRERAHVLGTDLSSPAIARARLGRYRSWSLRGVDEATRDHCFRRADDGTWQIAERLRRRVRFEVHNLALDHSGRAFPGIGEMDVIVCRNVLIYLDVETIARTTRALLATLADGGWLILGPSDPPLDPAAPVDTIVTPGGVLYRKRTAAARAVVRGAEVPSPVQVEPVPTTPRAGQPRGETADAALERLRALARCNGTAAAIAAATEAVRHHPLSPVLHLLHAQLLFAAGRDAEAVTPLRRVLYLDRSVAVAHFLMGTALAAAGKAPAALRAFRHARDRAAALAPEQPLPLGDGQRAGDLVIAADARIAAMLPARVAS